MKGKVSVKNIFAIINIIIVIPFATVRWDIVYRDSRSVNYFLFFFLISSLNSFPHERLIIDHVIIQSDDDGYCVYSVGGESGHGHLLLHLLAKLHVKEESIVCTFRRAD